MSRHTQYKLATILTDNRLREAQVKLKNKPKKFIMSLFTSKTITLTENTINKINTLPARSNAGKHKGASND